MSDITFGEESGTVGSKKQDFRDAVEWLRLRSWEVDEERSGYPMAKCPCGHAQKTVHRTPSNPRYYQQLKNRIKMIEKECQREDRK